MTLAELGMLLRGERVRCGYSVDEVASRLKITSRVVRSIEEGDLDGLPHAVYASGFIRAYATLVGVGEEEIRSALLELVQPEEQSASQAPVTPPSAPSRGLRFLVPVVFLLLFSGAGYALYASGAFGLVAELSAMLNKTAMQATPAASRTEPATPSPVPVVAKTSDKTAVQAATTSPASELSTAAVVSGGASVSSSASIPDVAVTAPAPASAASTTVASSGTGAVSEATPVRTSGFAQVPAAALKSPTSETIILQNGTASGTVERAGQGKNQVILTGLEECWVHSSADGTDIRQFSIKKGEVFALSFANKLVLKLGNAGGVQLKYNGQQLPAPGTSGQVKTLTFPLVP